MRQLAPRLTGRAPNGTGGGRPSPLTTPAPFPIIIPKPHRSEEKQTRKKLPLILSLALVLLVLVCVSVHLIRHPLVIRFHPETAETIEVFYCGNTVTIDRNHASFSAICEELLFRGFVLSAWESRGTWFAMGVTAVLFALLHGNLYGIPAYLLVGAVAGYLAFALDSLYAAMIYHTVYNASCLVLPYLASGQGEADVAIDAATVFSLALQTIMIAAMMAMLIVTLRLRARREGIEPIPRIRRPLEGRDKVMLLAAVLVMTTSMLILLIVSARGGVA